jgi:hypothetical protein
MIKITLHRPDYSGENLTLQIWTLAGLPVNVGGDPFIESPVASGRFEADIEEALPENEYRCDVLLDGEVEFFGRLYPRFSFEIGNEASVATGPDIRKIEFQFVANEAPVSGVAVRIAGRTLFSDTTGIARVWLTPNLYTARFIPPTGYEDIPEINLSVVNEDIEQEIELTQVQSELLPTPETCVVTIHVADQFGTSLAQIPVHARLPKGYAIVAETLNINTLTIGATDLDGLVSLLLLRDQQYDLQVRRPTDGMVTIRIQVPDSPSASLSQVVEV